MQFLIDRDKLLDILTKLASIIDARSGVAILRNVFLDVAATVFLRTTDTNAQLIMPCPAEVQNQGQITVDGVLLNEIVRKCPKGGQIGITLHKKTDRLKVQSGRVEFTLLTLPPDDWPQFVLDPGAAEFRLECRQLLALIEKTTFAVSNDQTRYHLNGVYLHAPGETLATGATDGHRLAVKTVPLPAGADDMPAPRGEHENPSPRAAGDGLAAMRGVIIPKDAAAAVLKILPDSEVGCELACAANLMLLRVGEVELISKLIEDTYPDWQRVVPAGGAVHMVARREALAKAVARVGIVLDERDHAIRMHFVGDAIKLTAYSGAIKVGANPRYLAEILETMDGARLAIILQGDAESPLLFEEVDGDGSLRMVLMPMRLPAAGSMPAEETKKKAA